MISCSTSMSEHKGNLKRFSHMSASHSLVPNQIFLRRNQFPFLRTVELGELGPCSKPSKQWEFLDFASGPPDLTDKKASYNGLDAVGPCMCLSLHVSNVYYKVVFTCLPWKQIVRFPMDPKTVYVLESRLISMDGADANAHFGILQVSLWHNSRVCAWYFQAYKFKYFMSVNKCAAQT